MPFQNIEKFYPVGLFAESETFFSVSSSSSVLNFFWPNLRWAEAASTQRLKPNKTTNVNNVNFFILAVAYTHNDFKWHFVFWRYFKLFLWDSIFSS